MLFVLAFAAVVVVFTAAMGSQATYNLRLASTRGQSDRAYYAANTGTQVILSLLREPPEPTDPDMVPLGLPADWSWLANDCSAIIPMPSTNSDAFAHLYHNIQGFPNATASAPEGTPIAPDNFYIVSVGVVNGEYDAATGDLDGGVRYEQATMGATMAPSFPIMPHAAFSFDELTIDGLVDHFNSKDGPGPYTRNTDETLPEASIGTELTDATKVKLYTDPVANADATLKIFGNVLLGNLADTSDLTALQTSLSTLPGGGPSVAGPNIVHQFARAGVDVYGTAGAKVTGKIDKLPAQKVMLNMDATLDKIEQVFPAGYSAGSDLTLKEGKLYKHQQDLVITGSRQITVIDDNGDGEIGDAILLVEGNVTFDGATGVNFNLPPRRLKIYSLNTYDADGDGKSRFEARNGTEAFALVAGKDMNVDIDGTSEIWGAVLGHSVNVRPGGAIHYDVTLRDPVRVAGVYGFTIGSSTIVTGVGVALSTLGAPAGTTTGTSGTGTSGTGTSGTTTTGCGCGCGGGSMLMMQKV